MTVSSTDYAALHPEWTLYKVYTDRDSGGNTTRWGFRQMIMDAYDHRFRIVLVKTISRFARNTVDLLETVERLKFLGIEIYFYQEQLSTSEASNDLLISTLSAVAQAESESIGDAIHWGIRTRLASGVSKLYARKCFGYRHNEKGELVADEERAEVVRLIYDLYLGGDSILSIIRELARRKIKSPQGKDVWSKRAVQTILANEKYTGNVLVGKTYTGRFPRNRQYVNHGEREMFLAKNAHAPIINQETFDQTQAERTRRSSINLADGQEKRKNTHYSSKRDRPKPKE